MALIEAVKSLPSSNVKDICTCSKVPYQKLQLNSMVYDVYSIPMYSALHVPYQKLQLNSMVHDVYQCYSIPMYSAMHGANCQINVNRLLGVVGYS